MVTCLSEETERAKEVKKQWLESNLNYTAGATSTHTGRRDHPVFLYACLLKQKHPKNMLSPLSLLLSQSSQSNCSNWSLVGGSGTSWKPVNSKYSHQAASCASPSGATFRPWEARKDKAKRLTAPKSCHLTKWVKLIGVQHGGKLAHQQSSVCNWSFLKIRQMQKMLGFKGFDLTLILQEETWPLWKCSLHHINANAQYTTIGTIKDHSNLLQLGSYFLNSGNHFCGLWSHFTTCMAGMLQSSFSGQSRLIRNRKCWLKMSSCYLNVLYPFTRRKG